MPPDVPRDFVCRHVFKDSASITTATGSSGEVAKKPLTSRERSQLLSDKPGTYVCTA